MAFVGGVMPIERPQQLQYRSRSAYSSPVGSPVVSPYGSPASSRRSSVSSIASAKTDLGVDVLDRLRQERTMTSKSTSKSKRDSKTSIASDTSSKAGSGGLKSLFGKSKKPKEKKDHEKIVLTSRHAAAVKTKLMMEQMSGPKVKTAGILGGTPSAHSSAAAQEARHPHSGPPTIHRKTTADLPLLTRILSGDEQDEEDELSKIQRLQLEWEESNKPLMGEVVEHEGCDDHHDHPRSTPTSPLSPQKEIVSFYPGSGSAEKLLSPTDTGRPIAITRNSYGGRYHRDESGAWRR